MDDATDETRHIGGQRQSRGVDGSIAEIATRQHGVIARAQLMALGLGTDAIESRIRAKRLLPLHRAVYAVGHRSRTPQTVWMAAVLAGGGGAVLSHRPAGAAWGICSSSGRPEVTVPRQRRPRRGIVFHHCALPGDETTVHDGIPVTTVPRTLFDLAPSLDERQLERAINEAEIRRLWDDLSLHDLLARYPRRPGAGKVRAALHKRRDGPAMTRSDLEAFFLSFADRFALPQPETNAIVEGVEVDCVWRERRLVVEVDGWETHKTRAAFERDRERSRMLQAAGWRCVGVTHRQLVRGAVELAADVRRLLGATVSAA
jgi:very-short-patch-repair endonuclease